MARLEDLIESITDPALRQAVAQEVKTLKSRTAFGLVFERHLPENILLSASGGVAVGDRVKLRDEPANARDLRVLARNNGSAVLVDDDGQQMMAATDDLLVQRGFGETVYPTLTPQGTVQRSTDRPYHAVINGENYHALELLVHCWAGQVDCIYADPPYNTGARDWKYNNDYVEGTDSWRHSKWLSMMEKRLRLAKKLLKPNGVLIITIDENEVHHLGVMLETLFPDALRQMVTICINPSGASGAGGLSRVEEYAFFCFLGGAEPAATEDDMLVDSNADDAETAAHGIRWERLLRRGNAWYREARPNLCYPVLLNEDKTRIIRAGEPYRGPEEERPDDVDGHPLAWPLRTDGRLGIWRVDGARLDWLTEHGYAYVSSPSNKAAPTLRYLLGGTVDAVEAGAIKVTGRGDRGQIEVEAGAVMLKRAKTVWYRGRHNAGGSGGTQMLNALLGERNLFPFPKSVYAVEDCLKVAVGDRPDALIVDFFAGSGTTLHATALLNAADGGRRRAALITNNEVDDKRTKELRKRDLRRGDPEFEKHGIFEAVTKPRCTAAISGERADGSKAPGKYLDGRPLADGFEENCEFFRLDYLNADSVELGREFAAVHPLLWLIAGARTARPDVNGSAPYTLVPKAGYGVLFSEAALREFIAALNDVRAIDHVFLVTDSEDAFGEMCESLRAGVTPHMLYRDYLRSFRIHAASPA